MITVRSAKSAPSAIARAPAVFSVPRRASATHHQPTVL
jgi:hypothetical protein